MMEEVGVTVLHHLADVLGQGHPVSGHRVVLL
jgi:hypothetical protein